MDRIRTLLLARTHIVVVDPDLAASAKTIPSRDADVERLEDALAQLGFVLSLDLALMLRRLPQQAIQNVRDWITDTLEDELGDDAPKVQRGEGATPYQRRIAAWLVTSEEQPCPWCGETKIVGALDPCGHLVCRSCWDGVSFAACPICHTRVTRGEPFAKPAAKRVEGHAGKLTLLHLGIDLAGTARQRFQRLLSRGVPLSAADRAEVEAMIDAIGPKAVGWLPEHIPVSESRAIAIARLWLVSANRDAMVRDTAMHVRNSTDVARVAAVLMGGNAQLEEPMRLRSLGRGMRRAILTALEQMPLEDAVDGMTRRPGLWKRIGERLHPFELAGKLPNAALAFAIVRRTDLGSITFGKQLRELAVQQPFVYVEDDRVKPIAWAGPIEDALRAGNPRSALARLTHRPVELIRRVDHLVRTAQSRQLDALQTVLKAVELAAVKGPPGPLLGLASHVSRRSRPWPRRVFFPKGKVLHAWGKPDTRVPLRGDAIAVMVGSIRRHLVARAEGRRQFPRAVIDRALVDLALPIDDRGGPRARLAWPRGSEIAVPEGQTLRLFLHWEEPANQKVDLDLSVAMFDADWRHVATCDYTNTIVGERAAVHSGDVTSAPGPLGGSEMVDLHYEQLAMLGVRHAVMVVFGYNALPFEQLSHAFAGLVLTPVDGAPFEPRSVIQRFDLRGRSAVAVPLALDLGERKLRWLDVKIGMREELQEGGGFRAALAHIGRDFADMIGTHSRPTLWDLACIHAAARANIIYIRERDGAYTTYRRRDGETTVTRLGRLMSGASDDGRVPVVPVADAPTWFALTSGMSMPPGSCGYVLDARGLPPDIERLAAADLVAELARV